MGLYTPSLLLDFAKTGLLHPAITCTRASTRTWFDANGQLRTAPANAPAFGYDPNTGEALGLAVEDAATNLALYSEATMPPFTPRMEPFNDGAFKLAL